MMTPDRPSKTRTIPLLFILIMIFLLVAVVAVTVILSMPIEKHFPPENPEIAAKRLSPDNGFYALERAARLFQATSRSEPQAFRCEFRAIENSFFSNQWGPIQSEIDAMTLQHRLEGVPIIGPLLGHMTYRLYRIRTHRSLIRYFDSYLKVVDEPFLEFEKHRPPIPDNRLCKRLFPSVQNIPESVARQEGQLCGTVIALALRLYQLEKGRCH